jgi:glycosyltransferase involved in cell wall biosynthesis
LKAKYKINNKKLILGVAQNWDEHKGLEDFARLPDLLGDDYAIVLIGLTEVQKEKLPSSIVKLSRTEKLGALVEWYSCADVFVNLTYQDTFPTVNLEAQACGTPVVTYMTGGSPESVPENYRVRQGDLLGVVSKIKEVCELDYKDREVNAVGNFNRSLLYLEYLNLYKTFYEKKKDS